MVFAVKTADGVIDVTFSGVVTIGERLAAMQEVLRQQALTGSTRVLADFLCASSHTKSPADAREYAERLASEPTLRRMSVAYVGTLDHTAGIESMAALRGYFFQRFHTRQAALRWLA